MNTKIMILIYLGLLAVNTINFSWQLAVYVTNDWCCSWQAFIVWFVGIVMMWCFIMFMHYFNRWMDEGIDEYWRYKN